MDKMKKQLLYVLPFIIGFTFRFILEMLYPYSPIGFDPMGYYVEYLYQRINPATFYYAGFLYYYFSYYLNSVINNPIFTIKLLDSINSGFYLLALTAFINSFFWKNKYKQNYINTFSKSLLYSSFALFTFPGLYLSWGLQRNLLAFSFFLLFLVVNNEQIRYKPFLQMLLIVLSGMSDPAILPLEFFVIMLKIPPKWRVTYAASIIVLTISMILDLYIFYERNQSPLMIFLGFFISTPLKGFYINVISNLVSIIIMIIPYIPFLIYASFKRAYKNFDMKMFISFLISIFAFLNSFANRYAAEGIAMLNRRTVDNGYKYVSIITVILIIIVSFNFLFYTNTNPSPYFYNELTIKTGEINIIPVTFMQSTVPLGESKIFYELFKKINDTKYYVVALLYDVGFAYEAGLNPSRIFDAGENISLLYSESNILTKEGYHVYTVWWDNGNWYGLNAPLANFQPVVTMENISLLNYYSPTQ